MLQEILTNLYELLIGRPLPAQYTLEYKTIVFPGVGLMLITLTLAVVFLYYYVLNRFISSGFYKVKHWVVSMIFNAALAFGLALYQVQLNAIELHSYAYMFATVNAIYSMILFVFFSLLLKKWSVQAWTTPVRWPHSK